MSNFNSTAATESKGISTHDTKTTGIGERHSASGRGRRADGASTYRVHDGESVTAAVVRAVGSETQTDSVELRPLHSVIDTEALNELFDSPTAEVARTDSYVGFDYSGHRVRVWADGAIQVQQPG